MPLLSAAHTGAGGKMTVHPPPTAFSVLYCGMVRWKEVSRQKWKRPTHGQMKNFAHRIQNLHGLVIGISP
jgi:hypothetical protein